MGTPGGRFCRHQAGTWRNGVWTALPCSGATTWAIVSSIRVVGGDGYAGGTCTGFALGNRPGYWFNGFWVQFPNPDGGSFAGVDQIIVR